VSSPRVVDLGSQFSVEQEALKTISVRTIHIEGFAPNFPSSDWSHDQTLPSSLQAPVLRELGGYPQDEA
jgi:hypothetical protein